MNIFRTSAASYFNLDSGTSGAAGGTSAPASSASPAPMSSSPSGTSAPSSSGPSDSGTAPVPSGGSTPSSAPAATPSAAPQDAFAGLDNDDWGEEIVEIQEPIATGTEPGAAPAPGAQTAPAVVPPADGTQPPPAAAPAPAATAPSAGNASSGQSPLDEAIEGFKANQGPLTDWAAGELFKLSPEEQTALDTDAQSMIPKLMARTYVQGMMATKNLIRNFVPQMIASEVQRITATTKRSSEALDQFYAAHKELDRTQHQPVVDKWLAAFRHSNPKASRADAIKFVGNAVKLELGIQGGASSATAAPRPAPFAPARQGGRAPVTQQVNDPFAGLDMDFTDGAEVN